VASTDRDPSRQVAYFVVICGGLVIVVLSLLVSQPTPLTWIEAALGAFLVVYAGYLVIRSKRQADTPDD
jgi:uncharacterized membrane protein YfcA